MQTLDYIVSKFKLDLKQESPFIVNYNRLDLPKLFKELGFKSGAEIGVLDGRFSEILCREMPEAQIYSIDAWDEYPLHKQFRRKKDYAAPYALTKERLSKYKNSKIIKKWSMDAVKDFKDESLDFVFIDADHRFQFIVNDLAEWGKKVKIGGIISGHDFGEGAASTDFVHVKSVIEAWTYSYKIHPWLILNEPLEVGWMWVKTRNLP